MINRTRLNGVEQIVNAEADHVGSEKMILANLRCMAEASSGKEYLKVSLIN